MRLRAEVAEARKASGAQPDTHDYSEAETRDYFIDLLLKEAGWPLDQLDSTRRKDPEPKLVAEVPSDETERLAVKPRAWRRGSP